MAAHMKPCLALQFRHIISRHFQRRQYARGDRRRIQDVLSPSEEARKFKSPEKVMDPRQNPFVHYVPSDPVQQNLIQVKDHSKRRNEEVISMKKYKTEKREQSSTKISVVERKKDKPNQKLIQEIVPSEQLYERLADDDKRFGNHFLNTSSKKKRQDSKEFLLVGKALIKDAVLAGANMKALFFSGNTLEELPSNIWEGKPVYKVPYKQMKLWCDVTSPQGVVGVFEMPRDGEVLSGPADKIPLTLICDQVRDPGNLGTLLRTAAAIGCQRVIASKGCVDIWDSKVLRSGAGAQFHVPILKDVPWSLIQSYLPSKRKVFVAECRVPSEQLIKQQSGSLDIVHILDNIEKQEEVDTDSEDNEVHPTYKDAPVAVSLYDEVDFSGDHSVLVVGGETGLSLEARKLAYDNYGEFVSLPMNPTVDSLNNAVAGSVLMYEILRQFRQSRKSSKIIVKDI